MLLILFMLYCILLRNLRNLPTADPRKCFLERPPVVGISSGTADNVKESKDFGADSEYFWFGRSPIEKYSVSHGFGFRRACYK